MKPTLFLLITVAAGLINARPLVEPGSGNVEPSNGITLSDVTGLFAVTPPPGSNDIVDKYTDGTEKVNKYGACVALQKDCKIIKSAVFSVAVTCDIYHDENCTGPKSPLGIVLPANTDLPNPYNIGSHFALAYICYPAAQKSPIDIQYNADQLGLTGKS